MVEYTEESLHSPDDFQWFLHNGYRKMCPVVHQSSDVVLGHLWQLFLKDTLKSSKDNSAVLFAVVVNDSKLDLAGTFLNHSRLPRVMSEEPLQMLTIGHRPEHRPFQEME